MRDKCLPEKILMDVRSNIRELRHLLGDPRKTFHEKVEIHIELHECRKVEHQARAILEPAKQDDVTTVRYIAYEEIPDDRLDEIVSDEYCKEILKQELSQ